MTDKLSVRVNLFNILKTFANRAACGCAYKENWSSDFAREQNLEVWVPARLIIGLLPIKSYP